FDEYQQSNIGSQTNWQSSDGLAKIVNNKLVIYFNGDHYDLRRQIREGLTRLLVTNVLSGGETDNISNAVALDLPSWFTEGYISFIAENWNPALDDKLKNIILNNKYKNFSAFAYDQPLLAGHAFWYYIEEKYKKENVTYFLYLTRI